MKRFSQMIFTTLAMTMLFCFTQINAQNPTVTQKITSETGEVAVKKKRLADGQTISDYLNSMDTNDNDVSNIEITIVDGHSTMTFSDNDMTSLMEAVQEQVDQQTHQHQHNKKNHFKFKQKDGKSYSYSYNYNYDYNYDYSDHKGHTGKKRALLGIYPSYTDEGVKISSLVSGGGAKAAGLQSGDLITLINGKSIQNGRDLRSVLGEYEPGESVTVTYLRNGQTYTTSSTLTAKKSYSSHRDPCKIFIGVNLGSAQRGVYVNSIIDGTAADKSTLQAGDIIIEMDGIEVNSFDELLVERNKHSPGDDFALTVLRKNNPMIVEAQFLSCDEEEETIKETPEEEIIEEPVINQAPIQFTNNDLQLNELNVFPNPTYGKINLQFKGEEVPTTIRITDITGKNVYTEYLNTFDGYYQRELMIENATPGNMVITVQQGNKLTSQQALLLPRA